MWQELLSTMVFSSHLSLSQFLRSFEIEIMFIILNIYEYDVMAMFLLNMV